MSRWFAGLIGRIVAASAKKLGGGVRLAAGGRLSSVMRKPDDVSGSVLSTEPGAAAKAVPAPAAGPPAITPEPVELTPDGMIAAFSLVPAEEPAGGD